MAGNFPFQIHVDENENKELREYFTEFCHEYIRVGPKNYSLYEDYKYEAASIYNLPLNPDDTFVVTYPRSGTTWTQELVWLVANNLDYKKAAALPITTRYTFIEFKMFLSKTLRENILKGSSGKEEVRQALEVLGTPGSEIVAQTASPRFVKSHLPLSLLPPGMLDTAKVVYVARDPRDVAVSFYHHTGSFQLAPLDSEFKTFWDLFTRGMVPWAPFFEHIKEAWDMRSHPNMLFLFYEDLIKDLPGSVRRVAEFFGKLFTDEEYEGLCSHLSFDNFKKNPSVNLDELKDLGLMSDKESFIRKGKSGGWLEYFDEEMARNAERWIADNLSDTDLRFPSI